LTVWRYFADLPDRPYHAPLGPSGLMTCRLKASGDWRPLVMKHKTRSKGKLRTPKTILRLPDLEVKVRRPQQSFLSRRSAGLPSCDRRIRGLVLLGAAVVVQQDRGCPVPDALGVSQPRPKAPSIFDSEQSGVSHTKLRIAGCSAQTWQPEYGELKALRTSE
jgi:hypothetical protein